MELEQLPEYFKCPISLETMSDPVILTSGHTFERSSIENWLNSGHRTCPVTKLPLPPRPTLIPNLALRNLISRFSGGGDRPQSVNVSLQSPRLQSLVAGLAFPTDLQTISQIHLITISDATFGKYLANSGKIAVLLQHLADEDLREVALRVILQVSLDADEIKVGLVADGAVDHVAGVLSSGGEAGSCCRSLAATVLTSLAVADVNKCTIGAHPTAVSGLVSLLRNGKEREKKEAATAVYVLCSVPENRKRLVAFGAVPVLVDLAAAGVDRAVEVLGLLGRCREGLVEMKGMLGFVGAMAGVLRRGKARGVEHALTLLHYVCADGDGTTEEEVWKEAILDLALGFSRREDTKVGKNAARLVATLHRRGFVESLL